MNPFTETLAKLVIWTGAVLTAIGLVLLILSRIDFPHLPGDIIIKGKNWSIFFPVTTCIIISLILTLILWLINLLQK